ncbi:MAG: malectin domain-containing carbohydrate-binding protein, partial [Gammaproteobacteria bacterium]
MACVAFAVLIACEADMPLSEARDTYRLNVGGESVDQSDGKTFSPTEVEGALRRGRIDQIFGSNDPAIYQSYVEGPISVGRSVPEGSYSLTLHFAEPDDDVKAGDRVFAVAVEETQLQDALDVVLFRDGRARSALTVTLPNIEVTDGALDVRLVPVKGQPILGALEIEPTRLLGEPDPS